MGSQLGAVITKNIKNVSSVAIHVDRAQVLSGSFYRTAWLWDVKTSHKWAKVGLDRFRWDRSSARLILGTRFV